MESAVVSTRNSHSHCFPSHATLRRNCAAINSPVDSPVEPTNSSPPMSDEQPKEQAAPVHDQHAPNGQKKYRNPPNQQHAPHHMPQTHGVNQHQSSSAPRPYRKGSYNKVNQYYNYPPNMYYGYYPYGYPQMVPGMQPMQYQQVPGGAPGSAPATPGTPGTPNTPVLLPGSVPPPAGSVSPYGDKVKITTKDGREVALDKKKTVSATSSSSSTPVVSSATVSSPVAPSTTAAPVAPAPAPVPAAVPSSSSAAPATLSVAEEFKRKILERAQAAKKEKDQKKSPAPPTASPTPAQPEKVKPASEQPAAKEPEIKEPTAKEPETKEPVAKEPEIKEPEIKEPEVKEPVAKEPEVKEPATQEPVAKEPVSEPSPIKEPEQVKEISKEAIENVEPATPQVPVPAAEKEAVTKDTTIGSETEPAEEATEEPTKETESHDEDDEEEEEPEEGGLDLSQFFQRLQEVEPIKDPFAMSYPEPLTGVDPKWKSGDRFRYDPQFLIQFKDVVQFPIDEEFKNKLESLGITAGRKGAQGRGGLNRFGAGGARFGPGMGNRGQFSDPRQNSRNGSRRRGGSSGPSRDKSTRRGAPSRRGGRDRDNRDDGITIPPEEIKPLEKSANRWVPKSRGTKTETKLAPDGSEILSEEDIDRKVKSLLNKLTLEMFEPISDDILKLGNQSKWEDDAKTVRRIISLTFAKACDEPYWSSMYAQFCAKMCTQMSDEIKDVNIRLKSGDSAKGGDLARRILLTTCQTEYEKGWSDKLPTNPDGTPLEPEMMSDEYYKMAAAKRRGLGLVKFIGHLYILNMLNDQVILLCLRDQSSNVKDPSEDSLENLAQLVNTVGARLETTEKNRAVLNIVFDNIQTILDTVKLSSRIKFKLMDLQDLRAAKWKSAKSDAGPKTIQEIHEDAEIKKLEEERAAIERRRKNKTESRSNSSRMGSSWGGSNALKKDPRQAKDSRGFTAVQPRSQSSRQNLASSAESANTSGNTVSPRENSKRSESIQSAANMFAALGGEEDDEDQGH